MKIDNLEIRTNPFKKSPVRKKDGLHQVKIRVFIGSNDYGKFRNKITLEVTILDESNNPVLASSSEFENRKSNKSLNLIILKTEVKIKDSVGQMIKDSPKKLKLFLILKRLYGMMRLKSFLMSRYQFQYGKSINLLSSKMILRKSQKKKCKILRMGFTLII
jgi:hypothetical protein